MRSFTNRSRKYRPGNMGRGFTRINHWNHGRMARIDSHDI